MNPDVARDIVYRAWAQRQSFVLSSEGWHTCGPGCRMQHLRAYACVEGNHAISTPKCACHPSAKPVLVNDLYVCTETGKMHVCNTSACPVDQGTCTITGQPVVCHVRLAAPSQRRCRRKRNCIYDNAQIARAFVYDLLFSRRRIAYEHGRYVACMDMARRAALRHVRDAGRCGRPLYVQDIVDIFVSNQNRLRSMAYLKRYATDDQRQALCHRYADRVMRLWNVLASHVGSSTTFESVVSAILYMMRRGVAYDHIFVVPPDAFLHESLPDAHAIKEVGVHRRQFTQVKNMISGRIRELVDSKKLTATQIADCYED